MLNSSINHKLLIRFVLNNVIYECISKYFEQAQISNSSEKCTECTTPCNKRKVLI